MEVKHSINDVKMETLTESNETNDVKVNSVKGDKEEETLQDSP